jgi:tetratricopeptide (TPR) repeat protein
MNAVVNVPGTNLLCQHGISLAQTAWMYEDLGYASAAASMYEQAVATLTNGIAALRGAVPDDALFHLGSCQLRLGCAAHAAENYTLSRQLLQQSLPNLEEAWRRFPANPWYQQGLVQASLLLGQLTTAEEVCERSPRSQNIERIGGLLDRAKAAWERMPAAATGNGREWTRAVVRDVFDGLPAWTRPSAS